MESVVFEAATNEELPAAVQVYHQTRDDMSRRHGRTTGGEAPEAALANYRHILNTGMIEVAKVNGQVEGVCLAIVRDDI
ncbi:MAG: hypothetical protein ACM3XM_16565, partial [Mycobacterium leprae]